MINYNGNLKDHYFNDFTNRAFLYGDSVFETIKVVNNKIMFWEEHYLRLMSSMRILRIKIPSIYTPDFFQNQIIKTIINLDKSFSGRVRLSVFRDGKGYYMPDINEPTFIITANKISEKFFKINTGSYKIDLYKDFKVQSDLLSNLKTNNKVLNVIASIYAKDNGLDNCILLNEKQGWNVIKSGCHCCPYQGGKTWLQLKTNHPTLFNISVEMEKRKIKVRGGKRGLYQNILLSDLNKITLPESACDSDAGCFI